MADEPAEGTAATAEPPAAPVDGLGDAGKAAIAAERKRANAAEKALKAVQEQLDGLTQASQTETEKAIDKARKEATDAATAEVTKSFRDRILKSEIRAQATGKYADPDDAIRLLELEDDVFDDDGEVRTDALSKQLDALLDRKPHLKADPSNGRPMGDGDAGKGFGGEVKTPEQQHQEFIAGVLTGRAPTR